MEDKIETAYQALQKHGLLARFMSYEQRLMLRSLLNGEEGEHFAELINGLVERIEAMPKTYETDGQGDDAIVHLHYFKGSVDAWVTERDKGDPDDAEHPMQYQAFGKVSIGYEPELGYVNIQELIDNGVELDLYWTPKTLKEVRSA